jgi:hypothetical protein
MNIVAAMFFEAPPFCAVAAVGVVRFELQREA